MHRIRKHTKNRRGLNINKQKELVVAILRRENFKKRYCRVNRFLKMFSYNNFLLCFLNRNLHVTLYMIQNNIPKIIETDIEFDKSQKYQFRARYPTNMIWDNLGYATHN